TSAAAPGRALRREACRHDTRRARYVPTSVRSEARIATQATSPHVAVVANAIAPPGEWRLLGHTTDRGERVARAGNRRLRAGRPGRPGRPAGWAPRRPAAAGSATASRRPAPGPPRAHSWW